MNSPTAPEYRELKAGDVLQEGDEWSEWKPVDIAIGVTLTDKFVCKYRRPVQPSAGEVFRGYACAAGDHAKCVNKECQCECHKPSEVETEPAPTREALCPGCDQSIYVHTDGTFYAHYRVGYPHGPICAFGGMSAPPAPATAQAEPSGDEMLDWLEVNFCSFDRDFDLTLRDAIKAAMGRGK